MAIVAQHTKFELIFRRVVSLSSTGKVQAAADTIKQGMWLAFTNREAAIESGKIAHANGGVFFDKKASWQAGLPEAVVTILQGAEYVPEFLRYP